MPYFGAVGADGAGAALTFLGLLARSSSSCSFTLRAKAGSLAIAALNRFSFSSASIGYFLVHAFVNVNTAIYVDGMRCRSQVMLSRMSERRREMDKQQELEFALETLVDQHGLSKVAMTLALICHYKAEHVRTNWQDKSLAREWTRNAKIVDACADKVSETL
jgi:hypothetical protein